ncbi:MAG: BON domain-containing protein, partial [Pseudolysinimonas sp.]
VASRVVTLYGTVRNHAERARIRHLVQAADGVHFIDNRIVVATAPATHH